MSENTVKKVTKANRFEDLKALLAGENVTYGTTIEDAIEFINHEVELLAKKNNSNSNSKRNAAKEAANEENKAKILAYMASYGKGISCTEILNGVSDFAGNDDISCQKVSSLMKKLQAEGKVVNTGKAKGRTMFELVKEG